MSQNHSKPLPLRPHSDRLSETGSPGGGCDAADLAARQVPQPSGAAEPLLVTRKTFLGTVALTLAGLALGPHAPAARAGGTYPRVSRGGFNVEQVADGVFVHTGRHEVYSHENAGDIANASFVVGSEAVAVIDTGGSFKVGEALRAAIAERTDRPVKFVVNTHMHPDHVFGNAAFEADGPVYLAHHKMPRGLAARADRYLAINADMLGPSAFQGTRIVMPTRGIDDETRINLGQRDLVLTPHPTAHTDNDLTVFDTKSKTLFLGDLLFSGHIPTLDGSIRGWLRILDQFKAMSAERVVPGHGPASMTWPAALEPQQRYLRTITREVRALISEGRTLAEAAKSVGTEERRHWKLFDEFHKRTVSAAYAELEWE